jgi:hypothetical protein
MNMSDSPFSAIKDGGKGLGIGAAASNKSILGRNGMPKDNLIDFLLA